MYVVDSFQMVLTRRILGLNRAQRIQTTGRPAGRFELYHDIRRGRTVLEGLDYPSAINHPARFSRKAGQECSEGYMIDTLELTQLKEKEHASQKKETREAPETSVFSVENSSCKMIENSLYCVTCSFFFLHFFGIYIQKAVLYLFLSSLYLRYLLYCKISLNDSRVI